MRGTRFVQCHLQRRHHTRATNVASLCAKRLLAALNRIDPAVCRTTMRRNAIFYAMTKRNRITLLLFVAVGGAGLMSPLYAQDAAAPFRRRSPSPAEATPTPEPKASATPQEEEVPLRAEPAASAKPQETATPRTPERQEKAAAAPAPTPAATTPARRVIQEAPVRAVAPRSPASRRAAPPRAPADDDDDEDRISPPPPSRSAAALDYWDEDPGSAIKALEKKWQKAIVEKDLKTIDGLLARDFVATSSTGKVGSKSTLLNVIRRDKNEYKSAEARGMSVRMLGPRVAVVTGVATERGTTASGRRFNNSRRFTDTWMLRNGKWQCVASQATEVPGS